MSFKTAEEAKYFDIRKFYQDQALKTDKQGTNTGIAVFTNGSMRIGRERGCHAYMAEFIRGNPTYSNGGKDTDKTVVKEIYTSLWSRDYSDSDLEYFRFILNETYSPWREHIKGREVIWGEKDGRKIPVAVKLVDMNASTQVVFNFMLASRMVYAAAGMMRAFKVFREQGFTRTESSFLSANVGVNPNGVFTWPYLGDFPYDTAFTNMDWKKWSTGSPRFNKTKKLCNSGDYSPCNAIWNKASVSSSIVIANKLKNTIIQNMVSEETTIKNVFGNEVKKRVPLSVSEATAKLKSNEEEWKCLDSTSTVDEQAAEIPSHWTPSSLSAATQWSVSPASSSTVSYSPVLALVSPPFYTGSSQSVNSLGSIC